VTPEVTETSSPTPKPTETPEPTIGSIEELVSQYGHPADYDYARIRIPFIGVDAPIGVSVVDGSVMGTSEGPGTVVWYDLSGWAGLGGRPGEGGNAIFGGHVHLSSYLAYADIIYHGPAVFQDLPLFSPGDRVFVDIDGQSIEYVVQWKEQLKAPNNDMSSAQRAEGAARWAEVWSGDVETGSITLYTCGGNFTSRSYINRVVVRAEHA
jgi:sortase (surface protein transpeptidase)